MIRSDRPDEVEIAAYVDGELPAARRAEIESLAADDPELARRIRDDLALMDALRAGQSSGRSYSDDSLRLALALQRRFRARALVPALRQAAVAAIFLAFGWGLNGMTREFRETPKVADQRFVDSAREALRVAELDLGPRAPGEPIGRKIDRLEAVTDVVMPQLPANWKVLGVQVQNFDGRPSVVVTAESPILGPVTLVAAPMAEEGAVPPTPAPDDAVPTVYWQSGGTAYALMGTAAPTQLKSAADGMEVASRRRSWSRIRG
jgi:anti-sigma factor RsiW